nr:MAG TPA: hypothetical protein [Caudoviricetes sp.]
MLYSRACWAPQHQAEPLRAHRSQSDGFLGAYPHSPTRPTLKVRENGSCGF